MTAPYLSFGLGFGIGFFGGYGWGWNNWDSIGAVDMQCMATAGTSPGVTRFTTGAITTVEEASVG